MPGSGGLPRRKLGADRGAGLGALVAVLHHALLGAAFAAGCVADVALLIAFRHAITTLSQPPDHLQVWCRSADHLTKRCTKKLGIWMIHYMFCESYVN